jgi:hypothetical protein
MKLANIFYSTFFNKCPRCHSAPVFKKSNPYAFSKMFQVHERCGSCDLKFEKEPSFFYGAMYVSYALTSGWFIVWFILYLTVLEMDTLLFAILVSVSIIALSPITLRLSRMLWLNFFYSYDKKFGKSIVAKEQIV